jgi:uncharacterized protein YlzI (FlbEa/FlbD family)
MANLAIKGHATRGKEVIEILEMLGGENPYAISTTVEGVLYKISNYDNRIVACHPTDTFVVFTLEEFLETFPYKVGDKVIIKAKNQEAIIDKIVWCCNTITYWLKYDGIIEGNWRVEHLQPYKEETMENKLEQITFDIPNGYEFFGINDDNQVVLAKKEPQYPKTYEECCEVLGYSGNYNLILTTDVDNKLFNALYRLKVCRDAYWKIAGDWKPNLDSKQHKFAISNVSNKISFEVYGEYNSILCFPTEEMRDAFYDNFKELIEECKELL